MKKRLAEKIVTRFERDYFYKDLHTLNKAYRRLKIGRTMLNIKQIRFDGTTVSWEPAKTV